MGMTTQKEEPLKFYRRFAAHFSYHDDTKKYVPTMACFESKDNSLKVCGQPSNKDTGLHCVSDVDKGHSRKTLYHHMIIVHIN